MIKIIYCESEFHHGFQYHKLRPSRVQGYSNKKLVQASAMAFFINFNVLAGNIIYLFAKKAQADTCPPTGQACAG